MKASASGLIGAMLVGWVGMPHVTFPQAGDRGCLASGRVWGLEQGDDRAEGQRDVPFALGLVRMRALHHRPRRMIFSRILPS